MGKNAIASKHQHSTERVFARARATITASGNIRTGLSRYKSNADPAELRLTVPMFATHPAYKSLVWPCPKPPTYSKLGKAGLPGYASLENEIIWGVRSLLSWGATLVTFLKLKDQADQFYLTGEIAALNATIFEMERSCGASLWLAELKIAAWEAVQSGKDDGSSGRNLAHTDGMHPLAQFIITWFAFRAKRNLSAQEFLRFVERVAPMSEDATSGLLHILSGLCPTLTVDQAAQIVSYAEYFSAIDRYLILRSTIQVLIAGGIIPDELRQSLLMELRALEYAVEDQSISRMIASLGKKLNRRPESKIPIEVLNSYTIGNYSKAQQDCDKLLLEHFDIEILILRQRCLVYSICKFQVQDFSLNPVNHETCPANLIAQDVARIVNFERDGADAISRLSKMALTCNNACWAASLNLFLTRVRNDDRIGQPTRQQVCWALRQSVENPSLTFAFESFSGAEAYLEWAYPGALNEVAGQAVLDLIHPDSPTTLIRTETEPHRWERLQALRSLRNHDAQSAIGFIQSQFVESVPRVIRIEAGLLLAESYLRSREYQKCADVCADLFLEAPYTDRLLPISDLTDRLLQASDDLSVSDPALLGQLPVVIVFDLFCRLVSPLREAERADAFKDFLRVQNVRVASELTREAVGIKRAHLIYFLRKICVPDVLDQSLALASTRSVEDERANVLLLLSDLTTEEGKPPAPEITEELRSIRTKQVVRETTFQLDQSRVYVNVEGVKRTLGLGMRETWQHYRLMLLHGDLEKHVELQKLIRNLVGSRLIVSVGGAIAASDKLLLAMLQEVRDLFATSKEFGLDANLSTNVRHGYIMRELRGPFVTRQLVTNKSTEEGGYKLNVYWLERHLEDCGGETGELSDALQKFTKEVDRVIEHLNRNVIRIRSDTAPEGLFWLSFSETHLWLMRDEVISIDNYEEFVELVLSRLWSMTYQCLDAIQTYLRGPVRQELNAALAQLQQTLSKLTPTEAVSALTVATNLVRPDINSAIERVSSWFVPTAESDFADYPLKIAYEAALATVRSYFRDLDMNPNFSDIPGALLAGPTLPTFVRVFSILIENAALHSGISRGQLRLRGETSCDGDQLIIAVVNGLDPDLERLSLIAKLDRVNSGFNREGAEMAIATEGGSGFPKIWRLLTHDLGRKNSLRASLTDTDELEVLITLDARGIVR